MQTCRRWVTVAVLFGIVGCATGAFAQTDQAKISGSVRDQSNAFVAGATVTVKNERTAELRTTTSNEQGLFMVRCSTCSTRRTSRTRPASCRWPCPPAASPRPNKIQPGQPYTAAAAASFGKITSTVGRTVGLGTSRQIQFALRVNF